MKRAILLCLPVLVGACGAPSEPPEANVPESRPTESNVIGDPLHKAVEKAQAVEGVNEQHKERMDEAIDQAN